MDGTSETRRTWIVKLDGDEVDPHEHEHEARRQPAVAHACAGARGGEGDASREFRGAERRPLVASQDSAPPPGGPFSGLAATPSLQPSPGGPAAHLTPLLDGRGWLVVQLATDLLAASLAILLALLTMGRGELLPPAPPTVLVFAPLLVAALHLRGLYRRTMRFEVLDGVGPVIGAVSVASVLLLAPSLFAARGEEMIAASLVARIWAFALLLVVAGRSSLALVHRHARARQVIGKPTLIVGAGLVGTRVARRLEERPEYGLRPVGFLDANPSAVVRTLDDRAPVMGVPEDLDEVAAATGARHVVFAFTSGPDHRLVPLARRCEHLGLEVSLVPRFFESITDRVHLERLGSLPVFRLRTVDPKGWQFGAKYALDRILAAVLIVLLAPLMSAVAAAVKLSSSGPVLFRQRRVGRDGQVFDLLKFRSMRVQREDIGAFRLRPGMAPGGVEGIDRRTPIGRWLRRTSVDELPQLFNVLKGEMSLVGPRPERPEFADQFGRDLARYADRHRVKSGITGWAQVSGLRGQTSLHDRIEWDNAYIENWSLWFDVKIMLLTLGAIVRSGHDA